MSGAKYLIAFVDFMAPWELQELTQRLSSHMFGGLKFVGLDEGIWDEVPAMRLQSPVLGLQIVVGGEGGDRGFTMEINTIEYTDGASSPQDSDILDISQFATSQLLTIAGISIKPQPSADK